jgi:uncharacterized protein YndB with AHSA1/START domain
MAQTAAAKPLAERPSLTLTRRFRARPEKVWAAWTEPETLIAWFCTTKAKPGSMRAELDVRVGGRYRVSFDMESGEHSEVGGVYREVVPNEKLVFSWAWHSTPERESLVTVSIRADGAGSLMVFTHEQFFDEAARDNHAKGWNELFAQLENLLA